MHCLAKAVEQINVIPLVDWHLAQLLYFTGLITDQAPIALGRFAGCNSTDKRFAYSWSFKQTWPFPPFSRRLFAPPLLTTTYIFEQALSRSKKKGMLKIVAISSTLQSKGIYSFSFK